MPKRNGLLLVKLKQKIMDKFLFLDQQTKNIMKMNKSKIQKFFLLTIKVYHKYLQHNKKITNHNNNCHKLYNFHKFKSLNF